MKSLSFPSVSRTRDRLRQPLESAADLEARPLGAALTLKAFGGCMRPLFRSGDTLEVQRCLHHEVEPGDVAVVRDAHGRFFVHLVIEKTPLLTATLRGRADPPGMEVLGRVTAVSRWAMPLPIPRAARPLLRLFHRARIRASRRTFFRVSPSRIGDLAQRVPVALRRRWVGPTTVRRLTFFDLDDLLAFAGEHLNISLEFAQGQLLTRWQQQGAAAGAFTASGELLGFAFLGALKDQGAALDGHGIGSPFLLPVARDMGLEGQMVRLLCEEAERHRNFQLWAAVPATSDSWRRALRDRGFRPASLEHTQQVLGAWRGLFGSEEMEVLCWRPDLLRVSEVDCAQKDSAVDAATPSVVDTLGHAAWALLVGAHRAALLMARATAEIPTSLYSPRLERIVLQGYYSRQRHYASPEHQHSGFLPFEERMLDEFFPKPPARILLHGAGGGREWLALRARGYQVAAFEPVPALVKAANRLAGNDGERVRMAAVQDWDRWRDARYDAVFTGWGMWTHLILQEDRLQALRSFREVCPDGPLLLSFFSASPLFDEKERPDALGPLWPMPAHRLERRMRHWLRERILRLPPLERGMAWQRGFYCHHVHPMELEEEAAQTGWKVAFLERDPRCYPHAALIPA